MADLSPLQYDPKNVEDMGDGFKVVPPGSYPVIIVESEVSDNKNKTGKILTLKYQIIEGPYTGECVIDRLNIVNQSDIAQKIALSQLKHICDAIGFTGQLTRSESLHGKPLSVKVIIEPFTSNTTGKKLDSNKIEKRMPRQSLSTMPAAQAADDSQPPKKMAW